MADHTAEVGELFRRAVRAGSAPGIVAAWGTRGDTLAHEAVGLACLGTSGADVTFRTWFDLASLTKPLVTTTLALLAFRSGALKPSTRVGEVLREARGREVGRVDVDALLTHTSGLPAWLPLYNLARGDPSVIRERLATVTLVSAPGERVIYSCVGFVLLGLMLSEVAGEGLETLFDRQVSSVLGLRGALGFNPDPETQSLSCGARDPTVERHLVAAAKGDPDLIPDPAPGSPDDGNARFLGGAAGNAGLFGTADGVAKLASEFLPGGGSLLSAAEAEEATRPRSRGLEHDRGWGWQIASSPGCSAGESLSDRAFGHTGFSGVSVWCDPVNDGISVLLTNRNHPSQRENDLHPLRRRFHALATRS
jgi:CubicO group peptidase (beta-lactamase class C family)